MSGHHRGVKLFAHGLGENHRVEENGGLCNLGLTEVFVSALKHEVGYAESEYLVGLLKHLFGHRIIVIEVFAHAYKLGTLTGKYKCFHV